MAEIPTQARVKMLLAWSPGLWTRVLAICLAASPIVRGQCEIDQLTAGDANQDDRFGFSVAVDGAFIAVGAFQDEGTANGSPQGRGAAYIFRRTGPTSWVQDAKLDAFNSYPSDRFGLSVDVSNDTAVVGAPDASFGPNDTGAAYLFERQAQAWFPMGAITASDGFPHDDFGTVVKIEQDCIVVGAPGDTHQGIRSGSVYIYARNGSNWSEVAKLVPSSAADGDLFGYSARLSGDLLVVGAPLKDSVNGLHAAGSAFIFRRVGSAWSEEAVLSLSPPGLWSEFGFSVDTDGDRVLVGSPRTGFSAPDSGSAYVFENGANGWHETAVLSAGDGIDYDNFGWAVSLSSGHAVVTAPKVDEALWTSSGAAYVFRETSAGWSQIAKVHALGVTTADGTFFGGAVDMTGSLFVVGASGDELSGTEAGSARVWRLGGDHTSYCLSAANSTGAPALITADSESCLSVTANEVTLSASPVPNDVGLFFYGPTQAQLAFGNGFLCVGGFVSRLSPTVAAGNVLQTDLDVDAPPTSQGQITAGSTWHFQAWFRDPAAGGSAFNLSDGVSLTFEP